MYTKLENLQISTKLLMLTVMICAAFIMIVVITMYSFSAVRGMLTDIVDRDMERVIVNAHTMRELSKMFSDRDLLNYTFYGKKDYLESEGTRLLGVVKKIEGSVTDHELKESILTHSGKIESFLSQCEIVNSALFDVKKIEQQIYIELVEFENIVGESMINLTLEGKDTSFIEQQMMLAIGFHESMLQIDNLFSEIERVSYLKPPDMKASPVILALDDLILRFQTLTRSYPGGTMLSKNLLNNGNTYKETILRYFIVMEQLGFRMKDLADSRTTIISKMKTIDSEISKTSHIMGNAIEDKIVTSGGIVFMVSGIVVIMLAFSVSYFTRSLIGRPMKSILKGIKEFKEGNFDAQIKLGRKDEWNMIENSFNDMAFELNSLLNKLEKRIEERTAELVNVNAMLQTDISKRKEIETKLAQKNKELEQILYVTSHDLRSPLVNIDGFSKELDYALKELIALCDSDKVSLEKRSRMTSIVNEDIPESMKFIRNSIEKMHILISGILKLFRTGRVELNIENINMNELMDNIVSNFEFQLKGKGVKVEISSLPSCKGDQDQLNQVFSNIIDNAIKYIGQNRTGLIKISGHKEGGQTVYCIEDNGIGIPPEYKDKIFEIFHQLDPGKIGGEGLGLTITHRIVELHKGKIWIESEPNKGSQFFVSIPF